MSRVKTNSLPETVGFEQLHLDACNQRSGLQPRVRIPETNRLGLAVPPIRSEKDRYTAWQLKQGTGESRHHLYWPKAHYVFAGSLALKFRNHPLNSIALPRYQHTKLHNRYDPFVLTYPEYLMPHSDVMTTFLDEASNLDLLGSKITMLDTLLAILGNGIDHPALHDKVEALHDEIATVSIMPSLEVVPERTAASAVAGVLDAVSPLTIESLPRTVTNLIAA